MFLWGILANQCEHKSLDHTSHKHLRLSYHLKHNRVALNRLITTKITINGNRWKWYRNHPCLLLEKLLASNSEWQHDGLVQRFKNVSFCILSSVNDDTGVFMRERSAGLYRLSAYYLAVMTTEIPVQFILPTIYVIINYWMVNLMPAGVNFIGIWLILVLASYVAQVSQPCTVLLLPS